jgi:flavodoxin
MSGEYGTIYVLVTIQPGKEQDFVYEVGSDLSFVDSMIEKMVFVHGSFDFIVVLTGNSYEIDRRILKMRKLSYVLGTETLIPFKWEIPKEKPKPPIPLPSMPSTLLPPSLTPEPAVLKIPIIEPKTYCEYPIVLYSTRGGNTKKVAEEIADELKCPVKEITKDLDFSTINLRDFDMVFIGTAVYRDHPNENMLNFLKSAEFGNQRFALFITWLRLRKGDKIVFDEIGKVLETKGRRLLGNYFECRGDYPNGHPDTRDFDDARKWASSVGKKAAQ